MLDRHRERTSPAPLDATLKNASVHGEVTQSIPLRRLWWASFVLLGLAAGAVGWTVWQLRTDTVRAATADAGNIAAVLASQLSRSLASIDAELLEIKQSTKALDIDDPSRLRAALGQKETHDALRQKLVQLPHLFNIVIADQNGQLVVSTAAWPTPIINIADREYFKNARTRVDGQLTISVPFENRIDSSLSIVFARRLENSSGQFAGIIFASVNFKYFEAVYESTEAIRSVLFTLVRKDGIILYRHPGAGEFVGKRLSGYSKFQEAVASGAKGFSILAQADGVVRYVSLRPVSDYPLFVNISVAEGVALEAWIKRSAAIGFGSAILLLCTLYLLIAITKQVRQLSVSEAALRESKQIIGAILDAAPVRIFWKDKNLAYLGCNAPFARDAGFAHSKDIVGKDDYQMGWRDQAGLYQEGDRQVIESGDSKLLIEEPQTTPEGTVNTLLTSKVPLRGPDGEVFGILGTYIDVTEHARLETQLRTAHVQLERQNVQFDAALHNMAQGLLMFDRAGKLVIANRRAAELFELPWERWEIASKGKTFPELMQLAYDLTKVTEIDKSQIIAELQSVVDSGTTGSIDFERTNGRTFCASCASMTGGGFVLTLDDITERRRSEDKISHLAHHDLLTDLPNRALFYEKMEILLEADRVRKLCDSQSGSRPL